MEMEMVMEMLMLMVMEMEEKRNTTLLVGVSKDEKGILQF